VAAIAALLLLAAVTLAVAQRIKLPFTVILVVVGMALGWASDFFEPLSLLGALRISPDLILYVFLPALIFESAFHLDAHLLRRNLGPVLTLAVPGLLMSTAMIGMLFAIVASIPWPAALLLGAILSATDPVAVIALFKRLGVAQRLIILVEGESLFNDATSIVLARLLLGIVIAGSITFGSVGWGLVSFLVVFSGGLFVGWLLALATGFVLGYVESNPSIEITLTTILAYLSFLLAEEVFHVSGVMATVAAGLTLGGWGQTKISPSVRTYLEHFWEYVAFVATALIFLLVGREIHLPALWESAGLVVTVILAMLVSRAVVVYGLMPLVNRLSREQPVGLRFQTVIYWGGLRGAIALAMVMSLPDSFAYKEVFVSVVIGAVLFTLLVQGLTIEPLVHRLGLGKTPLSDRFAQIEGALVAKKSAIGRIEQLQSGGLFSGPIALDLKTKCTAELGELKTTISQMRKSDELSHEQERALLWLRSLAEEKSLYIDMFNQGHLSERSFHELMLNLKLEIDVVRETNDFCRMSSDGFVEKLESIALQTLDVIPGMGWLAERLRLARVGRDYEQAWGLYQGSARVLEHLDKLARFEETPPAILQDVRIQYAASHDRARGQLDRIAEQFPEFVHSMQQRLARRMVLLAEAEAVETEAKHGTIPSGVLEKMQRQIGDKLRRQSKLDLMRLKVEPAELLRKVPCFAGISTVEFEAIAERMRARTAVENETIIEQGDRGDSLFLIARGVLRVSRLQDGIQRDMATLLAGDFFGEMAILNDEPRSATVRGVTPCSLYELRREDVEATIEQFPAIAKSLEVASRSRHAADLAAGKIGAATKQDEESS